MKKIALAIIIIGLIGFYFLDNSNEEKRIVQTQPIIKEKLKDIAHKVQDKPKEVEFNRSTIVEEKNETKEVKWCVKSAVYDLGNGRKSRTIYKDGARITFIDAQIDEDGVPIMHKRKEYSRFDNEGNLESIETYFNDESEASSKKIFEYENGVLKTRTMIANFSNGEIGEVNFHIIYDDEFRGAEDKSLKEDISFLTTSFYIMGAEFYDIEIEYHEEYDEEGRKIFAYSQMGDSKYKGIQYFYNENGELYASTSIYYQMSHTNETKFYNKDKKVIKVYKESSEELSDRQNRAKELAKENGHLNYWIEEMNMLMKDKIFQKDLTKSFKYNKNGQLIEEYTAWHDSNISYIYDEYGNLIKKIDANTNEVLFEQKFEVCEE